MSRLIEDHDDGGQRYSLEDRLIQCGTELEVYLRGGWLAVRFEMDGQQFPVFILKLGRGYDHVSMRLPDTAELRWPPKDEHPEETQVRKLRRVVEELADILASPATTTTMSARGGLPGPAGSPGDRAPGAGQGLTVTWPQECDFPPVVEASFLPIEGLPEQEEPHNHATAFGLAHVELEDGEEQGAQGVVSLFHPPAFDASHWEVLGYCVRRNSYETAHAFPLEEGQEARAYARAWRWRSWPCWRKSRRARAGEAPPGLL